MVHKDSARLAYYAYRIRYWSLVATSEAGSGHPTSCLSVADILAVLFFHTMNYDPCHHDDPKNDRCILSKGHAAPALYAAWREVGLITDEEMLSLRKFGSPLEGHPVRRFAAAEAATGSLGQGLSIGLGFAWEARHHATGSYTYVIMGDSELAEGSVWEAAEVAAHYKIDNLIAIVDVNRLGQSTETIDGWHSDRYRAKFEAFGWHALVVNGHDIVALAATFDHAKTIVGKPTVIIAITSKGYGIARAENKQGFHGKVFSLRDLPEIVQELAARFSQEAVEPSHEPTRPICSDRERISPQHDEIHLPLPSYRDGEELPTRRAYGEALRAAGGVSSDIVALDAEVKNSTYAELFEAAYPARFIQAFVAEQNMVGIGIGLAIRGMIPFVSTFGSFLTRAHDQLRMAAIDAVPVRVAGSHAGVSIGEDGPSQMALEDLAMMRSLPGSLVLYPSDAVSTHRLVELMANYHDGVSYIRLTRGATPVIYDDCTRFVIGGAHIVAQPDHPDLVIVAAGITVHEARHAYTVLLNEGIKALVVDCYSIKPLPTQLLRELFLSVKGRVVIVEDHYPEGGLGEAVTRELATCISRLAHCAVRKVSCSGTMAELLAYEEIDAAAIVAAAHQILR